MPNRGFAVKPPSRRFKRLFRNGGAFAHLLAKLNGSRSALLAEKPQFVVAGAAYADVLEMIGTDHFENIRVSRTRDNELWFLSKERGSRPIKLGQKMSEGAAISKKSLKISYSETSQQNPDLASESSRLAVAELDDKMTFTCYEPR